MQTSPDGKTLHGRGVFAADFTSNGCCFAYNMEVNGNRVENKVQVTYDNQVRECDGTNSYSLLDQRLPFDPLSILQRPLSSDRKAWGYGEYWAHQKNTVRDIVVTKNTVQFSFKTKKGRVRYEVERVDVPGRIQSVIWFFDGPEPAVNKPVKKVIYVYDGDATLPSRITTIDYRGFLNSNDVFQTAISRKEIITINTRSESVSPDLCSCGL